MSEGTPPCDHMSSHLYMDKRNRGPNAKGRCLSYSWNQGKSRKPGLLHLIKLRFKRLRKMNLKTYEKSIFADCSISAIAPSIKKLLLLII